MLRGIEITGIALAWSWSHKRGLAAATIATVVGINAAHAKPDTHSIPTVASTGTHALNPHGTERANYVSPWGVNEIDWPSGFRLNSLGNDQEGYPLWKTADTGLIIRQEPNNIASFPDGKATCVVNFKNRVPSMESPPTLNCELTTNHKKTQSRVRQ